jgi:hypothetical protein
MTIGERGKATVMAVPIANSGAACEAKANGKKGSYWVSAVKNPSYPISAACRAASVAPSGGLGGKR